MSLLRIDKLTILAAAILLAACYSDLDPEDQGGNLDTADNIYQTVEDYKSGLAKLYACFALSGQEGPSGNSDISGIDEGFGQYLRAYWNAQELTTDEAVIGWNDQTIKDYHWHSWSTSDVFNSALYSRVIYTVSLCNEYIREASKSAENEVKTFVLEARFVRALAYFHAIDLYGNVPFVTEANDVGTELAEQISRADLFTYIESELLAIENSLGEPGFEYGRADKAAAWMLLAKLYLNAKVYTGVARDTECITYAAKVTASTAYSLAPKFQNNFLGDNETSPEVIFSVNFDGLRTQTFGGTTYIINAQRGGTMRSEDFGMVNSGWAGLRTTSALVDLFAGSDTRDIFYTSGQNKEINDISLFTDGYAVAKFSNLTSKGEFAPGGGQTYVDTDFPMFRLADAYLMYAEAVLRGGTGGSVNQAITYVNRLRERAYGNTSGNVTNIDLDFILDERGRELYWEGHRRTDLVRFGKFTGGAYLWPWKGNAKDGRATDSYRDLFPIPDSDLNANPNLDQNDGY